MKFGTKELINFADPHFLLLSTPLRRKRSTLPSPPHLALQRFFLSLRGRPSRLLSLAPTPPFHQMKYVKPLSLFQGLLKIEPSKRGRLLGLDVGDKYVGLAISDPCNKVANPLSVLVRTKMNSELIATDFQSLISEYSLAGFVVGCPPSKTSAVQVKLFMDALCKTGKLEGFEYTYWNEFNSSKIPELMLKPLKPHPVHAKTAIDKFAAIYILQGYLDYINRKVKSSVLSK